MKKLSLMLALLVCTCLLVACAYGDPTLGEQPDVQTMLPETVHDILPVPPDSEVWTDYVPEPDTTATCDDCTGDDTTDDWYAVPEKPVIYLYPEVPTVCDLRVDFDGELTFTYPEHGDKGWQSFVAYPDGTLVFPDGKEYYCLFWEGVCDAEYDFSRGFCMKGEDTAAFLEWALAEQGLSAREANEFIIYWLPRMQNNAYNLISFQTMAYTDGAALEIDPAPDSLLRVFMAFQPLDEAVEIAPQEFAPFERVGFCVVEWGGAEIDAAGLNQ